ncbi:hypothetical protein TcCL_Unassigned05110 [Trypanosoma cruzi]|nr:hypothetical protein TcCL_Unassigned05110 [Trypanosoma cruzi]
MPVSQPTAPHPNPGRCGGRGHGGGASGVRETVSDGGRAAAVATWAATPAHRRHGNHRQGSSGACGTLRRLLLPPLSRPQPQLPKEMVDRHGGLRTLHSKQKCYTCIWFNFWSDMKTTSAPHNARSRRKSTRRLLPVRPSGPYTVQPSTREHKQGKKERDSCVVKKQGPSAAGVVPPARRIGGGASVTSRTLPIPGATPPALTTAASWDAPLTNKSHELTRIHPQRLSTAR